jgi:hypothetical protein
MPTFSFSSQVFCGISWFRTVNRIRYQWLSDRRYKLDDIEIRFDHLETALGEIDEISYESCLLAASQISDYDVMIALYSLHLVEYNPHLKMLTIEGDDESGSAFICRMIHYLSQRCPEVKDIAILSMSANIVRLVMDSFPKLTTIECFPMKNPKSPLSDEAMSYPNIESFVLRNKIADTKFVSLIKACPNLKALVCQGYWLSYDLLDVTLSCSKLVTLHLHLESNRFDVNVIAFLIGTIAEYAIQLQELSIKLPNYCIDIQHNTGTRRDLIRILQRISRLELNLNVPLNDTDDPESSICSLFSSPGVQLRSMTINTADENADMIAMMLQGCRNIEKLHLRGGVDISPVMMKISASCRQLVDLRLFCNENCFVDGKAMKSLLQSCHQLESLGLCGPLNAEAYESLAVYGGNLIKIELGRWFVSSVRSFGASSVLYDPSFKQQRKRTMKSFKSHLHDLDVKSLAAVLSCFGLIECLWIRMAASQLPADLDVDIWDNIPTYHARQVKIFPIRGTYFPLDSVFLAMMNSCRSLRHLSVSSVGVDASTLIRFAREHIQRDSSSLISLSYPGTSDISPLKELLPDLRLVPNTW